MTTDAYLSGELADWPDMRRMASLLQAADLHLSIGQYSIRLDNFSHFIFREFGGDLGDPQIEADADDVQTLAAEAKRVSEIFSDAGLIHRFEIYQHGTDVMTHYFHYGWPHSNVA
ncbi:MAG: hypothetical protein V4710_18235 [Verrucomicrobiota bacterium]